jgi:hypothetical protein
MARAKEVMDDTALGGLRTEEVYCLMTQEYQARFDTTLVAIQHKHHLMPYTEVIYDMIIGRMICGRHCLSYIFNCRIVQKKQGQVQAHSIEKEALTKRANT